MNVEVDDQHPLHAVLGHCGRGADGDVVERAEPLAAAGERMVRASCDGT